MQNINIKHHLSFFSVHVYLAFKQYTDQHGNSAGSSIIPYLSQYALSITHVMLQAYHEMADFLIRQGTMLTSKHTRPEPAAELEEKLRRPIKKLKGLVQGAVMSDQVPSLMSFGASKEDQVCTAYELARDWALPIPA